MSNAIALRRLGVRRWKPPSPEFIYHVVMSIAGLMIVGSNIVLIARGRYVVWALLGAAGWSVTYVKHREQARKAQQGAVRPIADWEWFWLALVLALAISNVLDAFGVVG
jgi:hypothetical protein